MLAVLASRPCSLFSLRAHARCSHFAPMLAVLASHPCSLFSLRTHARYSHFAPMLAVLTSHPCSLLSQSLAPHVNGLIAWAEERRKTQEQPCLVWRQTLPQHFATPDGVYQKNHPALTIRDRSKGCCEPHELGARGGQKFNDVTDELLKAAGIRIAPLYRAFVPLYKQHLGCSRSRHLVDCTNYKPEVYTLANIMTVRHTKPLYFECQYCHKRAKAHAAQLLHSTVSYPLPQNSWLRSRTSAKSRSFQG
jgi:hypothetical protein